MTTVGRILGGKAFPLQLKSALDIPLDVDDGMLCGRYVCQPDTPDHIRAKYFVGGDVFVAGGPSLNNCAACQGPDCRLTRIYQEETEMIELCESYISIRSSSGMPTSFGPHGELQEALSLCSISKLLELLKGSTHLYALDWIQKSTVGLTQNITYCYAVNCKSRTDKGTYFSFIESYGDYVNVVDDLCYAEFFSAEEFYEFAELKHFFRLNL